MEDKEEDIEIEEDKKIQIQENTSDEDNENYDYDFSIYEGESEEGEIDIGEYISFKKPLITNVRSRWNNGQNELDKLSEIGIKVSEVGIKIASRTQETKFIWLYYGLLDELWSNIKPICGELLCRQILKQKKKCLVLIERSNDGKIEHIVHNNLLFLRDMIYTVKQRMNLGLDIEKFKGGVYGKARRTIVQ